MDKAADTFVILSPAFAAYEGDTWLPAQEDFVRALNRQFPHMKVLVLSFHFPQMAGRSYDWFGNEVVAFSGGMSGGRLGSVLRWRRVWQELRRIQRERSIAGLFSFFCSECAFIGHHFAKRNGLTHLIWVLGQDARADNKQVRRIRPVAGELVCISDFLVREFERNHGIRPAHMIPIGIEPASFPEPVAARDIDLLGAGSLIPLKQYHVFIEVVQAVTAIIPCVRAEICGGGPEEEQLRQAIRTSGLQAQLKLRGRVPHAELLRTMQRTRVLLHTSSYEGLGAVCLEALYAGAHVISFCKPMDAAIPHWHIVSTQEEMAQLAIALLSNTTEYEPVIPYDVDVIAVRIMALYGISPDSSS